MSIQRHLLWLVLLAAPACASGPSTSANLTRSPTLDYHHHATTTSDGQIVGADRMRPEHKLRAGPQLGIGGLTPAEGPARAEQLEADPQPIPEDPMCTVLGLEDAVRRARCPKLAQAKPAR
ncbi:MAG: hypothetical protein ACMG6S_33440 [Byssovorax sp.]